MMLTVTGGQWFFPLVIICLILGIVATIAQKKKLTKLKRITDNFAKLSYLNDFLFTVNFSLYCCII